ncbi:MAG: hypothetical protein JRD94_19100 [Deltaproteobacteria bacterium]|nr:hypothetical protein [Deltaproteobacteria bacterium]
MPEVVGVPQPILDPAKLGVLVPPAHQTIGSNALALHEREVRPPKTARGKRAEALAVLEQRDEVGLLGKQLAALLRLPKPVP